MSFTRNVKEGIRAAIATVGLKELWARYRLWRGENVSHLLVNDRAGRFSAIYQSGLWLNGRVTGSLSGLGSELSSTTRLRNELPGLLVRLEVTKLLDIGCGDWTWMRHVKLPCEYVGADIVSSVIEKNKQEFQGATNSFILLDAVKGPIPVSDAILCREILFHLSFEDVRLLVANVLKSPARYFLATSDDETIINADIISGDFRLLNLRKRPFGFPAPIAEILDDGVQKSRTICVWRLEDLRKCFGVGTLPT